MNVIAAIRFIISIPSSHLGLVIKLNNGTKIKNIVLASPDLEFSTIRVVLAVEISVEFGQLLILGQDQVGETDKRVVVAPGDLFYLSNILQSIQQSLIIQQCQTHGGGFKHILWRILNLEESVATVQDIRTSAPQLAKHSLLLMLIIRCCCRRWLFVNELSSGSI